VSESTQKFGAVHNDFLCCEFEMD